MLVRLPPITTRAYVLLTESPDGLTAVAAAAVLGATPATVSCALARLWWAGRVDRRFVGRSYVYTRSTPKASWDDSQRRA